MFAFVLEIMQGKQSVSEASHFHDNAPVGAESRIDKETAGRAISASQI
jgi:hypothetical protein